MSEPEVARRNGAAVMESLRMQDAKIAQQQQRIDGLVASIAGLHAKVAAIDQFIASMRVKALGHGPTA